MALSIKILGTGCPNCKRLEAETRAALDDAEVEYNIEKVTEFADIASYGIMQTPGLVINDVIYASGRIPDRSQITAWAKEAE